MEMGSRDNYIRDDAPFESLNVKMDETAEATVLCPGTRRIFPACGVYPRLHEGSE